MSRRPVPLRIATGPALAAALVTAVACGRSGRLPTADDLGARKLASSLPACAASEAVRVDTVASGLEVPWDAAFLPDGTALVVERPGRIRYVSAEGSLDPVPWAELPVYSEPGSEVGLMGIDLAPGGDRVLVAGALREGPDRGLGRVAAGVARRIARLRGPDHGLPITVTVFQISLADRAMRIPRPLIEGLGSGYLHGGGALRIGPDGRLYLGNGDGLDPDVAQLPGSLRGKILRFEVDGSIPVSNPDPESPVFASGVRHSQGLAWHPQSGALLVVDHGPSGLPSESGRTLGDELDVVEAGSNLGWPIVSGAWEGNGLTAPLLEWPGIVAPAGLEVLDDPGSAWHGDAFVSALRGTSLRRVELTSSEGALAVVCEEILLQGSHGRIRMVRQAPDGTLWVGTSNRDGRGAPRPVDDVLLRLWPPPASGAGEPDSSRSDIP